MKASDDSMTIEEFKKYYRNKRGIISSVSAYDASGNRWVKAEELFKGSGAYTLIVVKFKNKTFLRITVKPSLKVKYSQSKHGSVGTWKSMGLNLTYEEKEFLTKLGDRDLSIEEIVNIVESSSFEGKEALAGKLKKARL
ncbi:hypothetical protein CUJ83_01055 [Methanocella sp. CWC-04]|uniref:Uncharacterized protein n=1 Tax=Methanooceanicella nereidis TaxID=2052831 RepID=A0AAP2RBI4_9EURY|nr:hypothetical protein [Methanocella sp. CWC-04]MCD1293585.1 hypothetical protein [Methanocella sp. CWC-04]